MDSEITYLRASASSDRGYTHLNPPFSRTSRNRIRRFQCFLCSCLLGLILIVLLVAIGYSSENQDDSTNSTTPMPSPSNESESFPAEKLPIPMANVLQSTSPDDDDDTVHLLMLSNTWPVKDAETTEAVSVNGSDVAAALAEGQAALSNRDLLEAERPTLPMETAAYRANRVVSTRPDAVALARQGFTEDRAMLAMKKILSGKGPLPGNGSFSIQLPAEAQSEYCKRLQEPLDCPETPFRSLDGTCNNMNRPRTWGVAMMPYRRMLPPVYEDGIMKPRSTDLPSAREVSVTVHRPVYTEDPNFTVMLAVWGQFIDHDITATALSQGPNGTAIWCCHKGQAVQHPECFPVPLGPGDPYFDKWNVTCMEFVRSAPAPTCSLGPREQLNQASSFLDGSVVYGPSEAVATNLRQGTGGRLKMSRDPAGRELLPVSQDANDGCNRKEMNARGRYCFASGDGRANENLHLTTMHLLWARHHNRLANKLHQLNPDWDDERLYQESRRVIVAQMQHITYTEFLPIILGQPLMSSLKMLPQKAGYTDDYDPEIDPSICNSFASSAFRFAHTLLPGLLKVVENDTSSPGYVDLHDMLFNPYRLYSPSATDASLRGAMETNIERADSYFSAEVTQHLFETPAYYKKKQPGCGLDLVSLNVQRGRDHGLPPYPQWRRHCGLSVPTTWQELEPHLDSGAFYRIKHMYKSVDEIDVYTGSLSEIPVNKSMLGPTVTCMLTDQFLRLKRGDRFWYETSQQPQAFSPEQLDEIRKTSLASVICDTSDGVRYSQPRVMQTPRANNRRVPCDTLPRPDFTLWKQ